MELDQLGNMNDLVVKSNRLNTVIQNLSLIEVRLMQLAVIDSRETQRGLSADSPLRISAKRYAGCFGVDIDTAYDVLAAAVSTLFDRRFSFVNERDNQVKTRWVSQVEYLVGEGAIEIILTPAVVNEITRIDGLKTFFTKYLLSQTASLKSVYSLRLYELLVQWRHSQKTPIFDLEIFRGQLGLEDNEYRRMSDFKRRVLDAAVSEINDKTDLKISYEQEKRQSTIIGFKFKVLTKDMPRQQKERLVNRDAFTSDMFTIDGLSDKQLWRISRHKEFISTYSSLATGDAGKSWTAYSEFIINEIKRNPRSFSKKRPIREYLDGDNSEYDFSS